MNHNGGSNNGSKRRNSTEVVDGLIHCKDNKTMKNLMISTCVIGNGLNIKSLVKDGDSSLLGCYALSVGKHLQTLQTFQDEGSKLIQNSSIYCIYQSTWYCIPEDLNSHQYCCGNFSSLCLGLLTISDF
jgi:hypothetical protein